MYQEALRKMLVKGKPLVWLPPHDSSAHAHCPIEFPRHDTVPGTKDLAWLPDLMRVFHRARDKEIIFDIIIHGSFGDFSATNFSDVEMTVCLKNDTVHSEEKLKILSKWIRHDLNKFIVSVDPIQHHGAFFLWNDVIKNYNEANLPLCAYEKAWSVDGSTLDFSVSRSVDQIPHIFREKLDSTINNILDMDRTILKRGTGMYSIKRVISNFLMVPVFFYQSKGIPFNKRTAIEHICKDFPECFRDAIALATEIRKDWPHTPQWAAPFRRTLVRTAIPQGRLDNLAVQIYRNRATEHKFSSNFRPLAVQALQKFRVKIDEN